MTSSFVLLFTSLYQVNFLYKVIKLLRKLCFDSCENNYMNKNVALILKHFWLPEKAITKIKTKTKTDKKTEHSKPKTKINE